jgi:citrate synthase
MINDTLTVVDNRTGKSYELPIEHGAIGAPDLRQIRTGPDDFGLLAYDPAFMNTAACKSRITFIDGDRGVLEYRGYPDRATRRTVHVPRDRVPPPAWRAADAGRA